MITDEGYELDNPAKIERARDLFFQKEQRDPTNEELLVVYDRLGGLIKKGGQTIKTGCFYDVRGKKAFAEPQLVYLYSVNGSIVEVPEGTELPGEVRAARILEEVAANKKKEAAKTRRSTKKPDAPQEEDEGEEDE